MAADKAAFHRLIYTLCLPGCTGFAYAGHRQPDVKNSADSFASAVSPVCNPLRQKSRPHQRPRATASIQFGVDPDASFGQVPPACVMPLNTIATVKSAGLAPAQH